MITTNEKPSGASKTQLPRWRVRGTGSSGGAFELRIRAADHAAAMRKASKPFVSIESCVLIEDAQPYRPDGTLQQAENFLFGGPIDAPRCVRCGKPSTLAARHCVECIDEIEAESSSDSGASK